MANNVEVADFDRDGNLDILFCPGGWGYGSTIMPRSITEMARWAVYQRREGLNAHNQPEDVGFPSRILMAMGSWIL